MSKLCLLLAAVATLTVFFIEHAQAETEVRRVKRQGGSLQETGEYPLEDVDLMQRIFRTPLKRQWCRNGMSYNPVLGTCTLSLAAMRGRGMGYRGM